MGSLLIISGMILMLFGACLLVYGCIAGGIRLYLILIFPVVVLTGPASVLGSLLALSGIFIVLVGLYWMAMKNVKSSLKGQGFIGLPNLASDVVDLQEGGFGGVVFLGPVPVVFGSSKGIRGSMMKLGIIIGTIIAILLIIQLALFIVL